MNIFSKIFRIASAIFTGIMIISMSFMMFPLSKVGDIGAAIALMIVYILMIVFWIYNLICLITDQNIIYDAITTGDIDVGAFFGTIGKGILLIPKGIWWLLSSLFFIILIPFRYLFVGIKKLFGKSGSIKTIRKNKKNARYNFEINNFIKEYARKYGRKITFDQAKILYAQEQAKEERKKQQQKENEQKNKEREKQAKQDKQQFEKDNKENIKNINKIVKDISLDLTWFDDIITDPIRELNKFSKLYLGNLEKLKNGLHNYFKEKGITSEEINNMFNKEDNSFNLLGKYNLNNVQGNSSKERERKELLFLIKSSDEMREIIRLFNSCDNPDDSFVVAKTMRSYYVKHNIEELYNNCEYNDISKEACDVAFAVAAKKYNKTPQEFKEYFEIDSNINTYVNTSKYKDYIN